MKSNSTILNNDLARILPVFNADAIIEHVATNKKSKISDNTRNALTNTLSGENDYVRISEYIEKFNKLRYDLIGLYGLTEAQRIDLKNLLKDKSAYRGRSTTLTSTDCSNIIALESRILTLEKTIAWWSNNLTILENDAVWDEAKKAAITQSENEKVSDKKRKKRVAKLAQVREEFNKYKSHIGYSGEALLIFLHQYLLPLEALLQNAQSNLKKSTSKKHSDCNTLINDYMSKILECISTEKKQIAYSMLYRMECMDYYNDVACDDLLHLTSDLMNHYVNIKVESKKFNPAKRRGLSAEMLREFSDYIRSYRQKHSEDKFFHVKMQSLQAIKLPVEWSSSEKQSNGMKPAHLNPAILFLLNSFDKTVIKIKADHTNTTLHNKHGISSPSLIEKLANSLQIAQNEYATLQFNANDKIGEQIGKRLAEARESFDELVKSSIEKVSVDSQNIINKLFDDVFNIKLIDLKNEIYLKMIKNVMLSNDFVISQTYKRISPDTDIILCIANRIAKRLDERIPLSASEIKNIVNLLKVITHKGQDARDSRMYTLLLKAQTLIQASSDYNRALIIHLVLNMMEIPFETIDDLKLALARHHYIASRYHETWIEPTIDMNASESNNTEELTCNYLQNVYMKIIHICPFVNYHEFDTNDIVKMLDGITLTDNAKIIELRLMLEAYTCEKLKLYTSMNDYLKPSEKIDVKNIELLISRINTFFTDKEYRNTMLESVRLSVNSLLKKHCLDTIAGKKFDSVMFKRCDDLYKGKISETLKNDPDILRAMRAYNEGYDGSMPRLAELLIQLWPHPKLLQELARSYSDNRISNLKHKPFPTFIDFRFYQLYGTNNYKKEFAPVLATYLSTKSGWHKGEACMIEIFGDDNQVNTYRAIGLNDVIQLMLVPDNEVPAQDKYTSLSSTHWRGKINKYTIQPNTKLADGKTVADNLERLINTLPWSPLLAQMTNELGNPAQIKRVSQKIQHQITTQSAALQLEPGTDDLTMVIHALTKTLQQLEEENVITKDSIKEFLHVFDVDVLSGIERIVSTNNISFDFNKLIILGNILLSFVSDNLKRLILQAHSNDTLANPYWFHMVNHMYSRKDINDLDKMLEEIKPSPEFTNFLKFTKRLTNAKHQINTQAKCCLFKDAGISLMASQSGLIQSSNKSFSALLKADTMNNANLIKFWLSNLQKLKSGLVPLNANALPFKNLIKVIELTNAEILLRIKSINNKNHAAVNFTDAALFFTDIQNTMSYEKSNTPSKQLLLPMFTQIQLIFASNLQNEVENILRDELKNEGKMEIFYKLCKDSSCTRDTIKSVLELKSSTECTKIMALMKIYNKLENVINRGDDVNSIALVIEDANRETGLKANSILGGTSFPRLLNRLASLTRDYFPNSLAPALSKRTSATLSAAGSK